MGVIANEHMELSVNSETNVIDCSETVVDSLETNVDSTETNVDSTDTTEPTFTISNVQFQESDKQLDITDVTADSDDEEFSAEQLKEIAELKAKFAQIEEENEKEETEQERLRMIDVQNTFDIFKVWMAMNLKTDNIYKLLSTQLDAHFRSNMFEYLVHFFSEEEIITDECLFYFKVIVADLIRTNKKFKHDSKDIVIDLDAKTCNLSLVKEKYMFKCLINDEQLCYFKENGNDFYVS
jgi:hypothetical protein